MSPTTEIIAPAPARRKPLFSLDNRYIAPALHHLHPAGRALIVRNSRKLPEDAPRDCHEHRAGAGARTRLRSQVDPTRERLHHGHQRRHSGSFAGLLALRSVRRDIDHVEVRAAREGPAHLESVELRYLGDVVSRAGDGGEPEHSVGQLSLAHAGHLGAGLGHHCAAPSLSYHRARTSRPFSRSRFCGAGSQAALAIGGRADHGPDVSAVHFLHDHRPEDDGALEARPMRSWSSWSRCWR